jgi:hypothetical protein
VEERRCCRRGSHGNVESAHGAYQSARKRLSVAVHWLREERVPEAGECMIIFHPKAGLQSTFDKGLATGGAREGWVAVVARLRREVKRCGRISLQQRTEDDRRLVEMAWSTEAELRRGAAVRIQNVWKALRSRGSGVALGAVHLRR